MTLYMQMWCLQRSYDILVAVPDVVFTIKNLNLLGSSVLTNQMMRFEKNYKIIP
jgi:hypothetical protein